MDQRGSFSLGGKLFKAQELICEDGRIFLIMLGHYMWCSPRLDSGPTTIMYINVCKVSDRLRLV